MLKTTLKLVEIKTLNIFFGILRKLIIEFRNCNVQQQKNWFRYRQADVWEMSEINVRLQKKKCPIS